MKALIICDYYEFGGAEIYVQNLIRGLKLHGDEVKCICFDLNTESNVDSNIFETIRISKAARRVGKYLYIPTIKTQVRKIVVREDPDIIILNHEYEFCFSVLKAVKGYKVINVIHDYRPICHNANCLFDNDEVCSGYKENNCYKNCGSRYTNLHIFLKRLLTRKIENNIQKVVSLSIAPSQMLADACNRYGYRCICINNPTDFAIDHLNAKYKDKLEFLYVGRINRDKGILKLCKQIEKYENIHFKIIGGVEKKYEDIFKSLSEKDHIEYLGNIPHKEIHKWMKHAFCVIIPSLWVENYPTVVLEAFAAGTLVLGSNRGGIKEMLDEGRGVIYDPLSEEDLYKKLNEIQNTEFYQYETMVRNGQEYLRTNNTLAIYIERLRSIFDKF